MFRCAAALVCLLIAFLAQAEDQDPVKEKLFQAKVNFDKEMRDHRQQAGEWFDKREDAARKAGDKKAVDQIKQERAEFDEAGVFAKGAPAGLRQRPGLARKALEGAYVEAIKGYTKAKKDDLAAAVEKELEDFRKNGPLRPWADAFPPGTYSASYEGGVKAITELLKDGTFIRTRDGKRYPGTIGFTDGKLVLKSEEFVEVWAVTGGTIKIEHWWPANTYPKGKSQSQGTAVRSKG